MFFTNPETSDQIYYSPALGTPAAVLLWVGLGLAVGIDGSRAVPRWSDSWPFWWFAGLIPGIITRLHRGTPLVPHAVRTACGCGDRGPGCGRGWPSLPGRRWQAVATRQGSWPLLWLARYGRSTPTSKRHPRVYRYLLSVGSHGQRKSPVSVLLRAAACSSAVIWSHSPYIESVFWTVAGDAAPGVAPLTLWENMPVPGSARDDIDPALGSAIADWWAFLLRSLPRTWSWLMHRDPWQRAPI